MGIWQIQASLRQAVDVDVVAVYPITPSTCYS